MFIASFGSNRSQEVIKGRPHPPQYEHPSKSSLLPSIPETYPNSQTAAPNILANMLFNTAKLALFAIVGLRYALLGVQSCQTWY
jgi:hypothetical protein